MDDKIFDQIQQVDLKKTMETSYIDYAMSVIASPENGHVSWYAL